LLLLLLLYGDSVLGRLRLTSIGRRVLDWLLAGQRSGGMGRERTGQGKGRNSRDAALSIACRIYFSRRADDDDGDDAMGCVVQTGTDHPPTRASLRRSAPIDFSVSSGHYERLLIVEIELHFRLAVRSVSSPESLYSSTPNVMPVCVDFTLLKLSLLILRRK